MPQRVSRSGPPATAAAVKAASVLLVIAGTALAAEPPPSPLQAVLANTQPLAVERHGRPPLVVWTPDLPAESTDAALEAALKALNSRGIALLHRWPTNVEAGATAGVRIGLMQQKLGMPVCIDGTGIAHGFYTAEPELGHIDADGKRFRDTSFFWSPGCPFAIEKRFAAKRALFEAYATRYVEAGVRIDYWMGDFEFDGPNEWNDGWATARKCTVCRQHIPDIDTDFAAFQAAVRKVRTAMQHDVFCAPLKRAFPHLRIGNYGMNPHDGYRYWWDFYERVTPELPHIKEDKALYRPWAREFATSGYTLAMPVIYTWYSIFDSYSFANRQYRWFYNMLREASSVAKSAPAGLPIIPFVHWTTTNPPKQLPETFEAMNEQTYEELLWHLLLRGCDSFAMWSPAAETAVEIRPVHRVYAASLAFSDFLDRGTPVTFEVPPQPGSVVSALRLGDRLLVRRTDFAPPPGPVRVRVGNRDVDIPARPGECFTLSLTP